MDKGREGTDEDEEEEEKAEKAEKSEGKGYIKMLRKRKKIDYSEETVLQKNMKLAQNEANILKQKKKELKTTGKLKIEEDLSEWKMEGREKEKALFSESIEKREKEKDGREWKGRRREHKSHHVSEHARKTDKQLLHSDFKHIKHYKDLKQFKQLKDLKDLKEIKEMKDLKEMKEMKDLKVRKKKHKMKCKKSKNNEIVRVVRGRGMLGKDTANQSFKEACAINQFELMAHDEEHDIKCLYANPVRVAFHNPNLLFVQNCLLCGAFGNNVSADYAFFILIFYRKILLRAVCARSLFIDIVCLFRIS